MSLDFDGTGVEVRESLHRRPQAKIGEQSHAHRARDRRFSHGGFPRACRVMAAVRRQGISYQ